MNQPSYQLDDLLAIMARLRDPEVGCPWDKKQTFASIVPYTLEEAYEVADSIERHDLEALKGELGDLLFATVNLVRHLKKDPEQVLRQANTKFERRFRAVESDLMSRGRDLQACSLDEMEEAWQRVKESEQS